MEILQKVNNLIWGVPTLILILGVGIVLSFITGFAQFRLLPKALKCFFKKANHSQCEGESPVRALCTALAATVGTGNLAGVAGAIAIGGPGAVFWIWVGGILGMVTKFTEATLSVHYRIQEKNGEFIGGPMYVICRGMSAKYHFLAYLYAIFGVIAAFGVGNATQINTVMDGIGCMCQHMGIATTKMINIVVGIILAVLVAVLFLGGAKRIGSAAESIVPIASVIYLVLGVGVLVIQRKEIVEAFVSIFRGAFCPEAVTGGAVGSWVVSLRIGASRGVFTNEAGMGTAGIAHASAGVSHPTQQGLMGIIEVFVDTLVICTITALVILCSGVPIEYGRDIGFKLTTEAFSAVYGRWVIPVLTVALCCFAFATVLGWGLYGARCAQFLFGEQAWTFFAVIQAVAVIFGVVLETKTVWIFADIVNGLMAIPNLLCILYMVPKIPIILKE